MKKNGVIDLTKKLDLYYYDLNLESDFFWDGELNESRFLILSNEEYDRLSLSKYTDYIIYDDAVERYYNLFLVEVRNYGDYKEIHFYI